MAIGRSISEKKERLTLIEKMISYDLMEDPYKPLEWYGRRFDELYDLGILKLKFNTEVKRTKLFDRKK